jgi:hypothetical protein
MSKLFSTNFAHLSSIYKFIWFSWLNLYVIKYKCLVNINIFIIYQFNLFNLTII